MVFFMVEALNSLEYLVLISYGGISYVSTISASFIRPIIQDIFRNTIRLSLDVGL